MFVQHFFELDKETVEELRGMTPQFGYNGFGEFLFYRTYSRRICDKCRKLLKYNKEECKDYCRNCNYDFTIGQENWADVVIRNINGTFSIRKDWYIKNHILWEEDVWQHYARHMAISMFKMEWSPPGRGLWAMGTDFIYERGSMALNNCAFKIISDNIGKDASWIMDALMLGVGTGFEAVGDEYLETYIPIGEYDYKISDDREGWCAATQARIDCYLSPGLLKPKFDYTGIRKANLPIRGFGGISSGPEPLIYLHRQIDEFFEMYRTLDWYTVIHLKADIINAIGCMVVSGNCRRSAELMKGKYKDIAQLKNYERYPYREGWGWMANNAISLETDSDFDYLIDIVESIKTSAEPGFANVMNFPYGRIGKKMKGLRKDAGTGLNPCLSANSKVLTKHGIRCISEINIGDEIWSEDGWTKIINKWSTGINKVYNFKTTAGIFTGTKNHRIVSEFMKIEVKDAVSIDIIKGLYTTNIILDPQDIIDGLVIGDGTIAKDNKIRVYIGKNDQDYFNSEIKDYINTINPYDILYLVKTRIKHLERTFNRNIPDFYLKGNRNIVCGFLRGLFSANGSVVGNRVQLKATSLIIIESVQMMLSSIGIKSYYTTNKPTLVKHRNGEFLSKQSYDLSISEDRQRFHEIVGFIQNYKNDSLAILIDKLKSTGKHKRTYDIISKEYLGEEETFDITVDNSTHTYWTQGCNVSNCGEIVLEGGGELCCLAITCPTKCEDVDQWYRACEYATMYASTVTLLPTQSQETNSIIARNRRIGVDITDISLWKSEIGTTNLIKYLRAGYKRVRQTNKWLNNEAGVPEAIRVTTIKPGGTVPKLPGVRSGWQNPTFGYTLRRVRCPQNQNIFDVLHNANVPHEPDVFSKNTEVFEFAIDQSAEGRVKPATEVSIWEQAMMLVLLQREWSDNAVSNTIYFRPKWNLIKDFNLKDSIYYDELEKSVLDYLYDNTSISYADIFERREHESKEHKVKLEQDNYTDDWHLKIWKFDPNHEEDAIEGVLAAIAPLTKSVSVLPHSTVGAYRQMPEEGLTKEEYEERLSRIRKIDWTKYRGSDGIDEKFCEGPSCTILPG